MASAKRLIGAWRKFQAIKEKLQEENLTTSDLVSSIKEKSYALTNEKPHSEDIVIELKEN